MTTSPDKNPLHKLLEKRISPIHLRTRLGIETDRDRRILGQGVNLFHIENWYSIHALIRGVLRVTGLHERGKRNALRLTTTQNTIRLPNLPEAFEGYRVLHLSDLHLDVNPHIADVLIDRISQVEYDVCLITGDYRAKTFGADDKALEAMQKVSHALKGPVYSILGNHDSIQMVPGLEAMGIEVLLNESAVLERNGERLYLIGIDDPHYYEVHNIEKAAAEVPVEACSIFLSHSPETYRKASLAGFDVFLCGHTHGGQICLPGGTPLMCNAKAPRKLCNGAWQYEQMKGYTSRGSGVSVVDVRYNCEPEITVHTLLRESDS
ncbi:MAG: metallophosphoesterase [Thiotrichales bacterium]